jgi:hypothetical protein
MSEQIISSIFFGLGLIFQTKAFLGNKIKKEDLKEVLKDIGGGFLFIFYALYAITGAGKEKVNIDDVVLTMIYAFCLGFGAAFAMSFKKKILIKINEINILILNLIFLYYIITRFGFDNWFVKIIYFVTFIVFVLIFFKHRLTNIHKGLLYIWFIVIFMIVGIINIYQISGDNIGLYTPYLMSFFKGGIFLYIWIYFVYLVMFIEVLDYFLDPKRPDASRGRAAVKAHFTDLANSFDVSNYDNFKILLLFIALLGILIVNYYNNYVSENVLVTAVVFLTTYLSMLMHNWNAGGKRVIVSK